MPKLLKRLCLQGILCASLHACGTSHSYIPETAELPPGQNSHALRIHSLAKEQRLNNTPLTIERRQGISYHFRHTINPSLSLGSSLSLGRSSIDVSWRHRVKDLTLILSPKGLFPLSDLDRLATLTWLGGGICIAFPIRPQMNAFIALFDFSQLSFFGRKILASFHGGLNFGSEQAWGLEYSYQKESWKPILRSERLEQITLSYRLLTGKG